jgi:PPOX class probable F420-dependent enzyme
MHCRVSGLWEGSRKTLWISRGERLPVVAVPLVHRPVCLTRRFRGRTTPSMAIAIPPDVRGLLERPNYVHLATLRKDGSPRSWVVWAGVEGERILLCTDTGTWKARDMQRDARVSLSVVDLENPYQMAALQGRVVEVRPDPENVYMDVLSHKYTGKPFPHRGPDRVCFVIEVDQAGQRTLGFEHQPGA